MSRGLQLVAEFLFLDPELLTEFRIVLRESFPIDLRCPPLCVVAADELGADLLEFLDDAEPFGLFLLRAIGLLGEFVVAVLQVGETFRLPVELSHGLF
ncbi:hypothetical protein D3C86_1803090 [compost metagenome]